MSLQLIKVNNQIAKENIKLEMVGEDILILSVEINNDDAVTVPNYYRILGDNTTPPLEIGINTHNYSPQSITLFINNIRQDMPNIIYAKQNNSQIVVNSQIFNKKGYQFVDENQTYNICVIDKSIFCLWGKESKKNKLIFNDRVGFFVNDNDLITGFCVKNFNNDDMHILNNIIT